MQFKAQFPILIAHRDAGKQSVAGVRMRQIQHELEQGGWKTIVVDNEADAGIVAGAHRGLAAVVFRSEFAQDQAEAAKRALALMDRVHERAPGLPMIALGETATMKGTLAAGAAGAAQPAQHPLPVRGHGVLPGAADHARRRGLPREPAAAVLQGADAPRRALGLLVAHAGARRRRGLPQVAGRLCAARVLRREHAALGPLDLGARTRLAARPHRPGEGGRGLCGQRLRRRPHLLRHQRHLDREQDRLALDGRAAAIWCSSTATATRACCTR